MCRRVGRRDRGFALRKQRRVLDLATELATYQGKMVVNVVHFTEVQKTLREKGRAELAVLLYRRMMMRIASEIARKERAVALITGENLGQVASQTIQNMTVIEDAATMTIFRPLLTFDKSEIVKQAKAINTFETSILPYDDCCSLFVPKHPATRARISDLETSESRMDLESMVASLVEGVERIVVGN